MVLMDHSDYEAVRSRVQDLVSTSALVTSRVTWRLVAVAPATFAGTTGARGVCLVSHHDAPVDRPFQRVAIGLAEYNSFARLQKVYRPVD